MTTRKLWITELHTGWAVCTHSPIAGHSVILHTCPGRAEAFAWAEEYIERTRWYGFRFQTQEVEA